MGIQNKAEREKLSKLRHSLRNLSNQLNQFMDPFFSQKPVIKGSVYELKRKCGKSACKCAQGELHSSMVVSASEKGKTRLRVIPKGFLVEVQIKVRRYQKLRSARAQVVEVHKKILQALDEMEAMRREEIPTTEKK